MDHTLYILTQSTKEDKKRFCQFDTTAQVHNKCSMKIEEATQEPSVTSKMVIKRCACVADRHFVMKKQPIPTK